MHRITNTPIYIPYILWTNNVVHIYSTAQWVLFSIERYFVIHVFLFYEWSKTVDSTGYTQGNI